MCGILGSINHQNTSHYLDIIKHRGPDGSGQKSFEAGSHCVQMLHRRLSIVDLSEAGSQPMESHDRLGWITFNGEIYNHSCIKKQLDENSFKGHSDTETILNYFREKGFEDGIKDLNGIFTIGYFDIKENKLYLARDRFGVKPLYYFFEENKLIFSSEIRPLKAILSPSVDNGALLKSIQLRYAPSPLTIYNNIKKVEPGQFITFDLSGSELKAEKKYFVTISKQLGTRKGDYHKLTREYGTLFEKAVERQLMSDVEVGILLSGGVDSALVAAIAKDKSLKQVKAFTIGFEEGHEDVDEISYAKQTAEVLGFSHFIDKLSFEDFTQRFKDVVRIVEEPIATTSIIPMFSLAKLAVSKVKVVLSGQGADEPLGGYNKYKGIPWLERSQKIKQLSPALGLLKPLYKKHENIRRLSLAMQANDMHDSYVQFNAIFSENEIYKLCRKDLRNKFIGEFGNKTELLKKIWGKKIPENKSAATSFLYLDLRTSLPDDLLMYTDKITMHFGLECRVPILDNDLIEFVESLDKKYKFNGREGKLIHKSFAREYLPSEIIERKKLGFKSPTTSWFKKNMDDIKNKLCSDKKMGSIFNTAYIKKILEYHENGTVNMEKQIFLLLSIYYLLEND